MYKILAYRNDYLINEKRKKTDGYGGIGYYRSVKPVEELKKKFDIELWGKKIMDIAPTFEEQWKYVFDNFDVLWTRYMDNDGAAAWVLGMNDYYNKKLKKPRRVIVDIDDNYLDVDLSNPEYKAYERGKMKRATVSALFSLADALTVSTEPLKERLQRHLKEVHGIDKPIYVIPNYNDINDWNFTPAKKSKKEVIIGYTGSVSHDDDLKLVLPSIKKMMEKYTYVRFQLLGLVRKEKIGDFFGKWSDELLSRVDMVGATEVFNEYPEWLSKRPWDIGIAPLVDTAFTRCKSHIKWMEYSMYKIPTIASRVYPYFMELEGKDTIIDEETGLLCTPTEWETKLERLIVDRDLRERLGENAYNFVKNTWQYKDSKIAETFEKMLKDLSAH